MNEELDERIVAAISAGAKKYYQIRDQSGFPEYRVLDRALQSLRKRGLIQYVKGQSWMLTKKPL
jgi:hypothetical protein